MEKTMSGIVAPKDPEKKRSFFYIMQDKEVFGAKASDGKGIQFLYQNDGRLINSAQIVGNIADAQILDLMRTTEGFRKLVHSIGVSAELEDESHVEEVLEFVFQMYGKTDLYGGGTQLRMQLQTDGVEQKLVLDDVEWSVDDKEPGQIRFEFSTPELLARVNVRLYLRDGFEAPEVQEDVKINFESEEYRSMIENSLMQLGDCERLKQAIRRAQNGEEVNICYIGGSITQGAGAVPINTECYAYKSWKMFQKAYGSGNVHLVKAGVGGTPSELGMIRFDRDVLRDGRVEPDIVVIEFAVNDEGDETKGNCYESLVRKALALPKKPAVVLLFSVFANDCNLQERLAPVGEKYRLPMVSILNAVTPQFKQKTGQGRVLSKNQFFYDIYHPSNVGHTIMADCLMELFRKAEHLPLSQDKTPEDFLEITPAIGADFTYVALLDKKDFYEHAVIDCGGFTAQDSILQCVEMDDQLAMTPEFPYNWMYDGTKKDKPYFEMKIKAESLLLVFKDSGEVDAAKAELYADGELIGIADPRMNGWVHCNAKILFQKKEYKEHTVRIQIVEGDEEKKFTILGFGYCTR